MSRLIDREPVAILAVAPGTTRGRLRIFMHQDAAALANVSVVEDGARSRIVVGLTRRVLSGTDDEGATFVEGAWSSTDSLEVELTAPLNGRVVVDSSSGDIVPFLSDLPTESSLWQELDAVARRSPALWIA